MYQTQNVYSIDSIKIEDYADDTIRKEIKDLRLEEVRNILYELSEPIIDDNSAYMINKRIIHTLFSYNQSCSNDLLNQIVLQLTLIDSMYSTQMTRRYFGIGELAEVLCVLSEGSLKILKYKFLTYLSNKERFFSLFDFFTDQLSVYKDGSEKRVSNLFTEGYGLGKNAKSKGIAVSLISKYAYFLTDFQFPIYDSVLKETYPQLCNYLCLEKMPNINVADISAYINAIDSLRNIIGYLASYDAIDRLLWYVGKIKRGNLSLLVSMEDYKKYGLGFNIHTASLDDLSFLRSNNSLYKIFSLAKKL